MKILFLDNYDSFTFNLVHYLQEIGAEVFVINQETISDLRNVEFKADALVVGPGPKTPQESGNLLAFMQACMHQNLPILGVCLGHQALGELLGMKLQRAQFPMHGKASVLCHSDIDVFKGLSNPMSVGRYHSLIITDSQQSPAEIQIFMRDEWDQIMAFRHRNLPFWGIQFHPESVLTPEGKQLLRNWIQILENASSVA